MPLLATKLIPPRPPPKLITRARLNALLADASERLLTVVRAPGGFGKTTLALTWVEALRARGDHVAWLSLDADDNEPRRFLDHLIRALQLAYPGIGAGSLKVGVGGGLAGVQALVVNEIADCEDELFLFLDDYHSVTNPSVHEVLSYLLRHAPSNLRFVVLSRSEPPLGLAALRARGTVLEIDATRLRFTKDETREFLELTTGVPPSGPDVRTIQGLTEGWPSALRITSLSFGAGLDLEQLLRSLMGTSRSIGSFLDELIARMPAEVMEFMVQTAVVERISAPLCEALTQRRDASATLAFLEQQQLVTAQGGDGEVFIYHQLLRDYLLQRLQSGPSERVVELHRRAAAWYQAHDLHSESIRHLLAARDTDAALQRITEYADCLVETGDALTLLGWEQQLRNKLIQTPLKLQLALAWARALALSREEAAHNIAAAERALTETDDAEADAQRNECVALRVVMSGLADDIGAVLHGASALAQRPLSREFTRDSANNALRFAYVATARWADLYAVPAVRPPSAATRASLMTAIYEAFVLGTAEMAQARTQAAEQLYLRCMGLGTQVRGFAGAGTLAAGPYAELLYETGRTEEASQLLRDEVDRPAGGLTLDTVLRSGVTAAKLAARRGDASAAYAVLERTEAVGLTHDWPRLVAGSIFYRLWLHLREGRSTEAAGLIKRLEQLELAVPPRGMRTIADIAHYGALGRAMLHLDQNRPAEAVRELEPLYTDATACGGYLLAIRIGAVLACACVAARSPPQGLRVFQRVLEMAEPGHLVAPIIDAGPEIGTLLSLAAESRRNTPAQATFIERLRSDPNALRLTSGGAAAEARAAPAAAPLSPRECEILALIAEGYSNKAIARELGLGPETVKSHLKNVFAKLGVDRRTQAVVRAAELGLVRPRRRL
ncbi:MAG TPA: LuxR C-terminal-related transcriptional regulator [Steroidobacteraceae bacterium]|nr:LuxR C-terminal-related transcriptional regulator [Steroidobacteraceae bacterium]